MNSTSKQHRHPGLWSIPNEASVPAINNIAQQLAITPQRYPPTGLAVHQPQVAEIAVALTQCASNKEMTGRWVTLIGQPETMSCAELAQLISHCGVAAHRVRWLRPSDSENKAWAAEQALLLNNSALIIAWLGQCQSRDAQRLQLARRHTQANTLLYTHNPEKTPLH